MNYRFIGHRLEMVGLNCIAPGDDIPEGLGGFSHLITEGSEATVLEENPWDKPLKRLLENFVITAV
jgi:hypothetical protein